MGFKKQRSDPIFHPKFHKQIYAKKLLKTEPLVFETFMKLGKLQCKSNLNRNEVLLLMLGNFETIQIVLYLPGGYMMDLETTCHVSCVMCHVSHVTFQPFSNCKS